MTGDITPGDIVTIGKGINTWHVTRVEGDEAHLRAVLTRHRSTTRVERLNVVRKGS